MSRRRWMTLLNRVRNALLPEGTLCMPLKAKRIRRAISVTARKIVAHHGSLSRNQRYSSTPFTGMVITPARGRHHYLRKEMNRWQYFIGIAARCKHAGLSPWPQRDLSAFSYLPGRLLVRFPRAPNDLVKR